MEAAEDDFLHLSNTGISSIRDDSYDIALT